MSELRAAVDRLAGALTTKPSQDVRRRWCVVTAINPGPPVTVDLDMAGTTVPGVRMIQSYYPSVGDTVAVDLVGEDPMVIGLLA